MHYFILNLDYYIQTTYIVHNSPSEVTGPFQSQFILQPHDYVKKSG